jgi:hypothetical protein
MSTNKIYEANPEKPYARVSHGQIVSRTLYGAVLRGDSPLDGGFGEVIEIERGETPLRVRIDTVPEDTVAVSPDAAAIAASVMQGLSNETNGQLGFRVEYSA